MHSVKGKLYPKEKGSDFLVYVCVPLIYVSAKAPLTLSFVQDILKSKLIQQ
jgi:hypothetical protein